MHDIAVLAEWQSFYIMTGGAAASLTGLMFVVITLVYSGGAPEGATPDGLSTFSTPTVVFFGAALLTSAILVAPWHAVSFPAILLGIVGLGGAVHMFRVMLRVRRLTSYQPDVEDWTWFAILPTLAYVALVVGALVLGVAPRDALYIFASDVVLLLFIGIHNSWDIVTYLATNRD